MRPAQNPGIASEYALAPLATPCAFILEGKPGSGAYRGEEGAAWCSRKGGYGHGGPWGARCVARQSGQSG